MTTVAPMSDPARSELHAVLRDGTRVLLRPIRPEDKDRIRRGLDLLSPRSRYLRFQHVVDRLSEDQLRYLTEVDHHDHEAWVALDEDEPAAPGMGVARYVRLAEDPTVAEAALTVLDDYQGRGLGTLLLAVIGERAIRNGVRTFRNYVLAENRSMLDVFEQLGATVRAEPYGLMVVDLPLPRRVEDLPDTPAGRAMRQLAGRARMGQSPPMWMDDHSDPDDARPAAGAERGDLRDWLDTMFDDD